MSKSVKHHDVTCSDNPSEPTHAAEDIMNRNAESQAKDISTTLARWYAANCAIRNLWAIDTPVALNVFVKLEPTSDGDDTLPVWFAHNQGWADDLKERTNRDVQLKLIVTDVLPEDDLETGAAMIAELSWRDPWAEQ